MARVILIPTEMAEVHFDHDPITKEVALAVMDTEEEGEEIIPHVGQHIDRNGFALKVVSVSEIIGIDGVTVYQALVDVLEP